MQDYQVRVIRKKFGLTLDSVNHTREIWDSLVFLFCVEVTLEWYEGAMVLRVFISIFGLETKVRENNWMGTSFDAVVVNFFRRCYTASTSSQPCWKFSLNNYEHLGKGIWKAPYNWRYYGRGSSVQPATRHLNFYFMLLFLSNKLNFKIEPGVDRVIFAKICFPFYLSIDIQCILKLIQYLYDFFIRTSKILMRFMLFFVKIYSHRMLWVFFILHEAFVRVNAKTSYVNNSLKFYCHEFMTKALRKAIMTRSRLKKVYLKNQNTTKWSNYKYQRNFCTNLLNLGKKSNLSFLIKV